MTPWRLLVMVPACLAGPVVAWLYETGACCTGGWGDVLVVTGSGAIGMIGGAAWVYRGGRLAGIVSIALNSAVIALYGFPVVFFLMGGSR